MRVFITGGTGYIGQAVAYHLLKVGHSVVALVRTPDSARSRNLVDSGVSLIVGDLTAPDTFLEAARASDAIVHAGFSYDSDDAECGDVDILATRALLDAARGEYQARCFIYTSSLFCLDHLAGQEVTENTDIPTEIMGWRLALEREVVAACTPSCASAVIRLAWVYGGTGGTLFDVLQPDDAGHIGFPDPGLTQCPLIHIEDLVTLYATVLARGAAGIFHATDGCKITLRDLARVIASCHGDPVQAAPIPAQDGPDRFKEFWPLLCMDIAASAPRARSIGWSPAKPCITQHAAQAFVEIHSARRTEMGMN